MARTRRSGEEVKKLAEQAKAIHETEKISIEEASRRVGISRSIYDRHIHGRTYKTTAAVRKRERKKKKQWRDQKRLQRARIAGSVDVSSLPPRPKRHGGDRRGPKSVDMNSVQGVAGRITRLDKLLAKHDDMVQERKVLGDRLIQLLKSKPLR